jgi:hypothetical protein
MIIDMLHIEALNGIPNFMKIIDIELSHKGVIVAMFKVLG